MHSKAFIPDFVANSLNKIMLYAGQVRSRALELVGSAYSSINIEDLAKHLGETPAQALASAASQPGWQLADGNMVLPIKPAPLTGPALTSEDQLEKLTQFVSFLEN